MDILDIIKAIAEQRGIRIWSSQDVSELGEKIILTQRNHLVLGSYHHGSDDLSFIYDPSIKTGTPFKGPARSIASDSHDVYIIGKTKLFRITFFTIGHELHEIKGVKEIDYLLCSHLAVTRVYEDPTPDHNLDRYSDKDGMGINCNEYRVEYAAPVLINESQLNQWKTSWGSIFEIVRKLLTNESATTRFYLAWFNEIFSNMNTSGGFVEGTRGFQVVLGNSHGESFTVRIILDFSADGKSPLFISIESQVPEGYPYLGFQYPNRPRTDKLESPEHFDNYIENHLSKSTYMTNLHIGTISGFYVMR